MVPHCCQNGTAKAKHEAHTATVSVPVMDGCRGAASGTSEVITDFTQVTEDDQAHQCEGRRMLAEILVFIVQLVGPMVVTRITQHSLLCTATHKS